MTTPSRTSSLLSLAGIAAVVAALLASVNAVTAPFIAAHEKQAAALALVNDPLVNRLQSIFPEADGFEKIASTLFHDSAATCIRVLKGKDVVGYGLDAFGIGYQSTIHAVVATDPDNRIRSVGIVSQAETEFLGTRILDSAFLAAFVGKNVDEMRVRMPQDTFSGIDALTAATISTRALVEDAVRSALVYLKTQAP